MAPKASLEPRRYATTAPNVDVCHRFRSLLSTGLLLLGDFGPEVSEILPISSDVLLLPQNKQIITVVMSVFPSCQHPLSETTGGAGRPGVGAESNEFLTSNQGMSGPGSVTYKLSSPGKLLQASFCERELTVVPSSQRGP